MRILHTIDSAGLYGAEIMLLNLALEQQRSGHTPVVLSIGQAGAPEKALETRARQVGIPCVVHRMRDGLNLPGGRDILRIAQEQRAEVIHSHGYKVDILLGLTMPRRPKRPAVVATLHGWTAKQTFSKLGLYRFLDQRLLHRLDAIAIVSEQMRNVPAVRRLDPRKVFTIANGIVTLGALSAAPEDALATRLRELRNRVDVVIASVGRLSPEKNVGALVEALGRLSAEVPAVGLAVLGDGPQAGELQRAVTAKGLHERVLLAGYVADASRYLPLIDVLALPSLTEGLPMILLEGMLANRPIIATRVGDVPRTLGNLGTLIKPGDTHALTDAIERIARDLPQFASRAAGGAQRVMEHFSAAAMAKEYERLYRAAEAPHHA